jgi:hypothetical protein
MSFEAYDSARDRISLQCMRRAMQRPRQHAPTQRPEHTLRARPSAARPPRPRRGRQSRRSRPRTSTCARSHTPKDRKLTPTAVTSTGRCHGVRHIPCACAMSGCPEHAGCTPKSRARTRRSRGPFRTAESARRIAAHT